MRADGATFPVELTITRIELPGPPRFAGYVRDITERRQRGGGAASIARAHRRGGRRGAAAARARPPRRRAAAAREPRPGPAHGPRQMDADPTGGGQLLDDAVEELAKATAELRELARGIHPAVLTRRRARPRARAPGRSSQLPVELTQRPTGASLPRVEARPTSWCRGTHKRGPLCGGDRGHGERDGCGWEPAGGGSRRRPAAAPIRTRARGCAGSRTAWRRSTESSRSVSPADEGTLVRASIPCA